MKEKKPEVRRFEASFIEISLSPYPILNGWKGTYKQRLDFRLPWNGKRRRIFRIDASAAELNYMEERIKAAKRQLKKRMLSDFDSDQE